MKNTIIFSFFLSLSLSNEIAAAGLSMPNGGIYLAIGAIRHERAITNEPIQFNDRLIWMPFCETGQVELSYPLDPAYGVRIKMTDLDGKEIVKTSLGSHFGSKFDRLHNFTETQTYPCIAEGAYKDNQELGGAKQLLTPKDLFQIQKPGIYTLTIEMQMFRVLKNTNQWSRKLVHFSPIRIRVEKPPDK